MSFWARMTSIFHAHQFFINSEHILDVLRAKNEINFFFNFSPFSPPGRLPNATTTPWKWFLRVPWWNTFQWDLREPPKPFLEKKNISGLKSLTPSPSPLCPVDYQERALCFSQSNFEAMQILYHRFLKMVNVHIFICLMSWILYFWVQLWLSFYQIWFRKSSNIKAILRVFWATSPC